MNRLRLASVRFGFQFGFRTLQSSASRTTTRLQYNKQAPHGRLDGSLIAHHLLQEAVQTTTLFSRSSRTHLNGFLGRISLASPRCIPEARCPTTTIRNKQSMHILAPPPSPHQGNPYAWYQLTGPPLDKRQSSKPHNPPSARHDPSFHISMMMLWRCRERIELPLFHTQVQMTREDLVLGPGTMR